MNGWIHIVVWAVLIGAAFGYLWWRGEVRRFAIYIQATREELKKCSWPTWQELKGSTVVIMISILLLGAFCLAADESLSVLFFKIFKL